MERICGASAAVAFSSVAAAAPVRDITRETCLHERKYVSARVSGIASPPPSAPTILAHRFLFQRWWKEHTRSNTRPSECSPQLHLCAGTCVRACVRLRCGVRMPYGNGA